MIRLLRYGTLVAVVGFVAASLLADNSATKEAHAGKLRHVVLFKFKEGATPSQIRAIEDAFRALPEKIPTIVDFEWGTNVSPENKAQGFTHCFLVTFRDAAGRTAYLPHPAHKAFGKVAGPYVDKVLVIDYVTRE